MDQPPLEEQVAEVRQQLHLLQSIVRDLQEEYGREVRTQRISVIDEEGVQRVILSAQHQTGSVLVRLDGRHERVDAAELYASEDPEGGAAEVGLCLMKDGNIVTTLRSV